MSTSKWTAEPWRYGKENSRRNGAQLIYSEDGWLVCDAAGAFNRVPEEREANAARIVQCVNACAKFPDPAAALTDLRLLLGQARGLLAEGDTDRADKMLIAMLGVLDGEEG